MMSMIKIAASQFKARLGKYMRAVREGKAVVITDRDQPVARLVPFADREPAADLAVAQERDPSSPALGELELKAIRYRGASTTALLAEDRERR
jgi:prevent-host-death family protein